MNGPLAICAALSCFLPLQSSAAEAAPPAPVKVMTWNILRGEDEGAKANDWPKRRAGAKATIEKEKPDILCVQEAMPDQVAFLEKTLPNHARVGVGRDDGKAAGEQCAVFFDSKRFKAIEKGTFWLSDAPDKPGRGWDPLFNRVCTWVCLQDSASGRTFSAMTTHLAHESPAQAKSVGLILERAKPLLEKGPVLLTGDTNCTHLSGAWRKLAEGGLQNAEAGARRPAGTPTFLLHGIPVACIDGIFVSSGWKVDSHQVVVPAKGEGGARPSDHLPVTAALSFAQATSGK